MRDYDTSDFVYQIGEGRQYFIIKNRYGSDFAGKPLAVGKFNTAKNAAKREAERRGVPWRELRL